MAKFVDRMVGRSRDVAEDGQAVARLSDYTVRRVGPPRATTSVPAAGEGPTEVAADYAKLGAHVTSVLEAAKQAAATIREEAVAGAQQIGERSLHEANVLLEKARTEAEDVAREASRLRIEAQEESRELKERANEYAADKRREADRQASALLTQAKREASEHAKAAQERGAALDRNIEQSEQRLRQLVGGLRDLADRLEEVLGQALASTEPGGAEISETAESMEESLRPSSVAERASKRKT